MSHAPEPPRPEREDVERGSGPAQAGDVEGAPENDGDQAGAVSPELGPGRG